MGAFATFRDDVKYVVVMRNPEEAVVSFKPFIEAHNPNPNPNPIPNPSPNP